MRKPAPVTPFLEPWLHRSQQLAPNMGPVVRTSEVAIPKKGVAGVGLDIRVVCPTHPSVVLSILFHLIASATLSRLFRLDLDRHRYRLLRNKKNVVLCCILLFLYNQDGWRCLPEALKLRHPLLQIALLHTGFLRMSGTKRMRTKHCQNYWSL